MPFAKPMFFLRLVNCESRFDAREHHTRKKLVEQTNPRYGRAWSAGTLAFRDFGNIMNFQSLSLENSGWLYIQNICCRTRSLALHASVSAAPAKRPARRRGSPARVSGETRVVSTANWAPPDSAKPLAMTSMRRSSMCWTCWTLRSASLVWATTILTFSLNAALQSTTDGSPTIFKKEHARSNQRWVVDYPVPAIQTRQRCAHGIKLS